MKITDRSVLRSIQREAGRQADFFFHRNDHKLAIAWSETESLVTEALKQTAGIELIINGNLIKHPIIKHGEQVQQPPNPLTGKALQ